MGQEFGTHEWMLTHAIAIETSNKTSDIHGKPGASIMTDVFLMTLCQALLPQQNNTEPESFDSE